VRKKRTGVGEGRGRQASWCGKPRKAISAVTSMQRKKRGEEGGFRWGEKGGEEEEAEPDGRGVSVKSGKSEKTPMFDGTGNFTL